MLDSILLIGKNNRNDWLKMFTKSIKEENKKENILVNIIFDLDNKKVEFEPKKLDEEVAKEYRYINKTFRAAREQLPRLTFEINEFKDVDDLKDIMENIIKQVGEIKKRIKCESNIKDILEKSEELEKILNEIKSYLNNEEIKKQIANEYSEIKTEYSNIECFTISIKKNGNTRALAKEDLYTKFIETYIKYPSELKEGSCHICRADKVLVDPAFESGSLLKIYAVDKKGFISGISGGERFKRRTFAICPECRLNLIIGSKYISNNLAFSINLCNIYVIPRISFEEYNDQLIKRLVDIIKGITSYGGFTELNKMINDLDELFQKWYIFTIIFGSKKQAAFDLEHFVQEVPITNIRKIYDAMNEVTNCAAEYWGGEERRWDLTLTGIVRLYPFKNGKEIERRPLIELLSSILQLHPYPINKLFEIAINWAKITYYNGSASKNKGSKNSDIELVEGLVKFNYLLILLKKLGMVSSVNDTKASGSKNLTISDERIKKWVDEMQYNDLQIGLFMLGYLISQIGNAQYNRGDEKKSILDKIDFKGMKREKILTLVNEIPAHLRNYRILKYNELNYYYMMEFLNRNQNSNRLDEDPIGNLFYILSGYAYGTYNTITAESRGHGT